MHGYHIYKDIWEAAVGETVVYMLEPGNFHDRNVVAVEKLEESLVICITCLCSFPEERCNCYDCCAVTRRCMVCKTAQASQVHVQFTISLQFSFSLY